MAGSEHAWMGFIPIPVPGEDSHDTYCGDSESLETAWLLSFLLSMVFSLFLILKLSHNLAINCFFVFKNESESHSVMSNSLLPPRTMQSMEFSRLEYWSGWLYPPPGDLPNPGIKPRVPALQADSLSAKPQGKTSEVHISIEIDLWISVCFTSSFLTLNV